MPIGVGGITGVSFDYESYQTYYLFQDDSGTNSVRVGSVMITLSNNPNTTATQSSSFCTYGGLIYMCCGYDGTNDILKFDVYNPLNDTWGNTLATPATAREQGGLQALNGKIYYFGGNTGGSASSSNEMDVYDIVSNTWKRLGNMPIANGAFGSCNDGNYIYMFGGFTHPASISNDTLYRYNPLNDTWTQLASSPNVNGLAYANLVYYNRYLYIPGGQDGSTGNSVNTHYRYNIATDTYTTLHTLPTARDSSSTVLLNNKLYLLGGNTNSVGIKTVVYYDFTNDVWISDPLSLINTSGLVAAGGIVTTFPIGNGIA